MIFDVNMHLARKMHTSLGVLFRTFYLLEGKKEYRMKITTPDGKRDTLMYVKLTFSFPREDCRTLLGPL